MPKALNCGQKVAIMNETWLGLSYSRGLELQTISPLTWRIYLLVLVRRLHTDEGTHLWASARRPHSEMQQLVLALLVCWTNRAYWRLEVKLRAALLVYKERRALTHTRHGSAAALTYSLRMHEQTGLSADSNNMKRSHSDRNGSKHVWWCRVCLV